MTIEVDVLIELHALFYAETLVPFGFITCVICSCCINIYAPKKQTLDIHEKPIPCFHYRSGYT